MVDKVIRSRSRRESLKVDRQKIADRVIGFYDTDMQDRDIDLDARLQRYAKYRMWTEPKDWPWKDASNIPLSDMTEKSLRVQDTLHNAVMSQRPAISAEALRRPDQPKQKTIDSLLDYQFFEEQPGEVIVGELAEEFVNDGVFTAFVPWVKETRRQSRVRVYDRIPAEVFPPDHLMGLLRAEHGTAAAIEPMKRDDDQPWDYIVTKVGREGDDETTDRTEVRFYTRDDGRVEAAVKSEVQVYDGPRVQVMDYDDVFHPVRAANLQPPGPSNPGGAQHVVLRTFPTVDEIERLRKSGYYDLLTVEEAKTLSTLQRAQDNDDAEEKQKDDLGGKNEGKTTHEDAPSHNTLTRLLCFDRYDIDGDGLDEDVVWWVLLEPRLLVKGKVLQEMWPMRPNFPRPLAEASLFPVRGRRVGISLLEMLEGLHDAMKTTFDQSVDSNTIGIAPFFFYRPTSSMQSESISLGPGEGFPLSNPQQDVHFPQIGNPSAQGMSLNLVTLLQQLEERVSVVGDMQLGRVPAGRSSALRTVGGMSLLAGQGEARPERMLRRFFLGLVQIWQCMHDLNQHFLPKGKQFRISGSMKEGEDPYLTVADRGDLQGQFSFKFAANVLNTSKQQMQQTLQQMLGTFVNQLAVQLGIADPSTIYNLMRDYAQAFGVDAEQRGYIKAPAPGVGGPRILAEEAMLQILADTPPQGEPLEPGGWMEHLQKLLGLRDKYMDEATATGELTPAQAQMLTAYIATAQQKAAEEQQRMAMQQAAQAFSQQMGAAGPGAAGGRPPERAPPDASGNPAVSGGAELVDETLPGAGGGGNA